MFLSLVSSPPAGFQIENVLSVLACVQALLAGLGKEKMSHWAKGVERDGFSVNGAKPKESKKVSRTHRMGGKNS